MNKSATAEERAAAAATLAKKAEIAARCGSHGKAAELQEVAMLLDPSPVRIRAWLAASARTGSATHREAMTEVASWF